MKEKVLMPVMTGLLCLLFLSSIAGAAKGPSCKDDLATCTNSLNICTTSLGTSITNQTTCQANLTTCLDGVANLLPPPSWSQELDCTSSSDCPRFEVLADWGGAAVLDKETGLVWEKSPSTSPFDWEDAQAHCNSLATGNRLGWRLPTIQELASPVNPSATTPPALFAGGYPFSNVLLCVYWSATTSASDASTAWSVLFTNGNVGSGPKSDDGCVWCVRGGKGVDPQ